MNNVIWEEIDILNSQIDCMVLDLQSLSLEQVQFLVPEIDQEENSIIKVEEIIDFVSIEEEVDKFDQIENENFKVIDDELQELCKNKFYNKEEIVSCIKKIIVDLKSNEELQSFLFDLLGFDEFEIISKIVQKKSLFQNKGSNFQTIYDAKQSIFKKDKCKKYPNVYSNARSEEELFFFGKTSLLPAGTQRKSYNDHEEVLMPVVSGSHEKWIKNSELIKLSDLDLFCQKTFSGYKNLNPMQSLVYPVAYKTNENLLVCAPTGAGKTDVAILVILNLICQNVYEITQTKKDLIVDLNLDGFKIVYIAPLKALVQELVEKFKSRLNWLNISIKELTGDIQLTKSEINSAQLFVATPEKWDIITRKLMANIELINKVKLLIIDEIHSLNEDRGSIIESIVARSLRQIETSQLMIRIVGLSATLPNYVDVADFLAVNKNIGLFVFDETFRPVSLVQRLLAVKQKNQSKAADDAINNLCYSKLIEYMELGSQVMIFVNSRFSTITSARTFISIAQSQNELFYFESSNSGDKHAFFENQVSKRAKDKFIKEFFPFGISIHHAGLSKSDRNLVEKMFEQKAVKVLFCTSTLACGINLPASVVMIKETKYYDPKKGGFVNLGACDLLQIFGRAGRPQYEKFGTGVLFTTTDMLDYYISLLTRNNFIESKFSDTIIDNLNAEISSGTIMNVDDAIQWLKYTYLYVRMQKNPFHYGITNDDLINDKLFFNRRKKIVLEAIKRLNDLQMIFFEKKSELLIVKDLGRIASEFYLLNNSIEIFNKFLDSNMSVGDIFSLICKSSEFEGIKFRKNEAHELKNLLDSAVEFKIKDDFESDNSKINILLQSYLRGCSFNEPSLNSDALYIAKNTSRICKALFFICINRKWSSLMKILLTICKSIDNKVWIYDHPLCQYDLPIQIKNKIRKKNISVQDLKIMSKSEIYYIVQNQKYSTIVFDLIKRVPLLDVKFDIFPITNSVLKINFNLNPNFHWDDKLHGMSIFFWLMVEDLNNDEILYIEKIILKKKLKNNVINLEKMIYIKNPKSQMAVSLNSDTYFGTEVFVPIKIDHHFNLSNETIKTKLLNLNPLPINALHNSKIESIYSPYFHYFNPMQTMVFHTLYNSSSNVLIGSPTGSGKTLTAELAIWKALNDDLKSKIIYIAPMKALVREKIDEWKKKISSKTNYKLFELTGDSISDLKEINKSTIIVTTPEKFDCVSRGWKSRDFIKSISLVIMDEIHLIGSDRGPILEVIVSRLKYISSTTNLKIRLLGLSTFICNSIDIADFLGVKSGLFNFPQCLRPIPLKTYIHGFSDNLSFCPLMKAMNKPIYATIKEHSPDKSVLIFVPSRRQCRLTASDIISLCAMETNTRKFLNMSEFELQDCLKDVVDDGLRFFLQFGIAIHHAGLLESDRNISHKFFEKQKIQILIATSTLAWGVNLPAHLVIVKGTQFFDTKISGYKDMCTVDILQMIGRAGRPSLDTSGIAVVFTKESKKQFYKDFLNEGFPVESSLHKNFEDHLGAEISSGVIKNKEDALEFLTRTFLYKRVKKNPLFYNIEKFDEESVNNFLFNLIDKSIVNLKNSKCLHSSQENLFLPTKFLHISSNYYISHLTVRNFLLKINNNYEFKDALILLSQSIEFDALPVRHGEELINMELSEILRYKANDIEINPFSKPHTKAFLLFQSHFSRLILPIEDYIQDLNLLLDQVLRIIQAYIDIAVELNYLNVILIFIKISQCIKQKCWFDDDPISVILNSKSLNKKSDEIDNLNFLTNMKKKDLLMLYDKYNTRTNKPIIDKKAFFDIVSSLPLSHLEVKENNNHLIINLYLQNNPTNDEFKTYCPYFSKVQKEYWYFIIYEKSTLNLLQLKRSFPKNRENKSVVSCVLELNKNYNKKSLMILCINDAIDLSYSNFHTIESQF